jgi:acyl carrier protein
MNEIFDIEQMVYDTLRRVAEEEGLTIGELHYNSTLVDDLGFRSLHLARILAILEMDLDFDPFASGDIPITSVRTVGDLCSAYERK